MELALFYHAFNLFADGMDDVVLGRFDTLYYLQRPMYDIGELALMAGRDESLAEQMLG